MMRDTPKIVIDDALSCDPSWWLSSIPTPPFDRPRIKENWHALVNEVKRLQPIERELAAMIKRADEMERLKEHNAQMFYRLERDLADLKAQHAWRPIADGMPPINEPVLILAKTYLSDEPIVCAATWNSCGLDKTVYWNCHGASGMECENEFDPDTITHWQPLPEQPKEGAE